MGGNWACVGLCQHQKTGGKVKVKERGYENHHPLLAKLLLLLAVRTSTAARHHRGDEPGYDTTC